VRYVVISLKDPQRPVARAFQIHKAHPADEEGVVREEPIEIVDRLA
jgi:hypothetical protein